MDQQKDKTLEEKNDELYSGAEYEKKQFTFSKSQLAELKPLLDAVALIQTFIAIGQIAAKAMDNYVAGQVIPPLGEKASSDVRFFYEVEKNKIVMYVPRYWCSRCNERKAEYKYEAKAYCPTCMEKLKQEVGKPIEVEEKKKVKA